MQDLSPEQLERAREMANLALKRGRRSASTKFALLDMALALGPAAAASQKLLASLGEDVEHLFRMLELITAPVPVEKSAEERSRS